MDSKVDILSQKERRKEVLRQLTVASKVCLPEDTKVFIFGSQANRETLKSADIDVGILAREKLDFKTFGDFKLMVEALPNFYVFDIVDFNNVAESFKKLAMQNIEYLDI
jgi:predicted nucleotidyltransferase